MANRSKVAHSHRTNVGPDHSNNIGVLSAAKPAAIPPKVMAMPAAKTMMMTRSHGNVVIVVLAAVAVVVPVVVSHNAVVISAVDHAEMAKIKVCTHTRTHVQLHCIDSLRFVAINLIVFCSASLK